MRAAAAWAAAVGQALAAGSAGAAAARPDSLEARLELRACASAVREEAVARCTRALALGLGAPRAVVAQRLLGRSLAALERWDEALAAYREALRLAPDDPETAFAVGMALLHGLGRPVEAEPFLRLAVAGRPDDAQLHLQLGIALNATGRHAEALGAFKSALDRDLTVLDQRPAAQAIYLASLREALWP